MSSDPIVAGTDGSATAAVAVDKAGELAQALGAPVHVVCVPGGVDAYEWPPRITAQEIVAAAADRLRSRGITVETHLPKDEGDPALALVAAADSVNAQIIVVGNKGMTGIRRLVGSFPNTVSHKAQRDVLIVATQSGDVPEFGERSIVVGTDGSVRATRAVEEATRLAKALGGKLQIVSTEQADPSEAVLAAAAAQAAEQGVEAITHVVTANPAEALIELAEQSEAAIIVVGSKGMHADDRERFGNIPDRLSHTGASSVLIVFTAEASGDAMSGAAAGDVSAA